MLVNYGSPSPSPEPAGAAGAAAPAPVFESNSNYEEEESDDDEGDFNLANSFAINVAPSDAAAAPAAAARPAKTEMIIRSAPNVVLTVRLCSPCPACPSSRSVLETRMLNRFTRFLLCAPAGSVTLDQRHCVSHHPNNRQHRLLQSQLPGHVAADSGTDQSLER